ncbi:helix-turn-helix domain-containing protein [Avibacterium paragallinarum]
MAINEKIRLMREMNHWSQEEMAEKMSLSPSGYAKIERGETRLHLDKLEKIAQIFDVDIIELLQPNERSVYFMMSENGDHTSATYYGSSEPTLFENEKLKLSLKYKDQIIEQKDKEIQSLQEIIQLLKAQLKQV